MGGYNGRLPEEWKCVSSNASGEGWTWPGVLRRPGGGDGSGDGVVVAGGRGLDGRRGRAGSRGLLRQKQLAADVR